MTVSRALQQPAPFIALMVVLACGIAVIAALAVSLLIGSSLQRAPIMQPVVGQTAVQHTAPDSVAS